MVVPWPNSWESLAFLGSQNRIKYMAQPQSKFNAVKLNRSCLQKQMGWGVDA